MWKLITALLVILSAAPSAQAEHCYPSIIKRADVIALVNVDLASPVQATDSKPNGDGPSDPIAGYLRAKQQIATFRLRPVNVLKGGLNKETQIAGFQTDSVDDFDGHTNFLFWLFDGGSCRPNEGRECFPRLAVDETYLVFLERTPDGLEVVESHKAIEPIKNMEDAWLKEVKRILSAERHPN